MNLTDLQLPPWQNARRPLGAFSFAFLASAALAVGILTGCEGCNPGTIASSADAASYVAGVEDCLRKYTPDQCEERLACKQKVQVEHGLAPSGSCDPIVADAGADGAL